MHLAPKSRVQTCKMQHKLAVEASLGLGKIACDIKDYFTGTSPKMYFSCTNARQKLSV